MTQRTSPIVSKKTSAHSRLTATALSSAILLASTSSFAADEPKSEPKKLDVLQVEGDTVAPSYKADKVSSPKFTQPLVDTPQTIVVVKKELFQQQAATTLSEALRNTPGITMLLGENGNTATGDSIFMRGFDTQSSIFVDGIRDIGSISRDTFNTEQVEIAKGPAGVDNGRGAASGYVNLGSKFASLDNARSGNLTVGTADYKRATLDVNQTLSGDSALRVNLLKQDAGVDGRDEVESNFQGFAGSLGFGLSGKTRSHFNLLSMEQSGIPDGGVPTIGLEGYYNAVFDPRPTATSPTGGALVGTTPGRVDSANFYGSLSDKNDVKATMATVRIEHDFSDTVTLRNTSRYGRTDQNQVLTGVNAIAFPSADPNTWTVARTRQGKDQVNQILANQSNLTASFSALGVKHELASGIEFLYESQSAYTVGTRWPETTSTERAAQQPANLYQPNTNDVFQSVVRDNTKINGSTTTYAFYALDTITLDPQWEISVGLRSERFHTETDQIARQGVVAGQPSPVGTLLGRSASVSDQLLGWKLGGVYKPVESGSIYLSYATSQQPPGGANFQLITDPTITNNANMPNLDPQKGENLELGTKWNLFDEKLGLTAAIFKTSNENEIAANPDGTNTAVGSREVQGIELGLNGIVTQGWQINLGLAVMDSEITNGNRSELTAGSAQTHGGVIQWMPKTTFTVWNSYEFDNGLLIGGGFRYIDSAPATSLTDPETRSRRTLLEIPSYWVADAMASYPLNEQITLQLNVLNLTDEEYVATVNNSSARYYPGAPMSVRLGATISF